MYANKMNMCHYLYVKALIMICLWHEGQALRLRSSQLPELDDEIALDHLPGVNLETTIDNDAPMTSDIMYNRTKDLLDQFVKNNGGRASILLLGDSTVASLHYKLNKKYLPVVKGLTINFVRHNGCLNEAWYASLLKPPPTAVLWNFGLHLLHSHPIRSCMDRGSLANCGAYRDVVKNSALFFNTHAPSTRLFWKTTNSICESKFTNEYLKNINEWHNESTKGALEEKCRSECSQRFGNGGRQCQDELFDRRSTFLQHETSLSVIESLPFKVDILDAFRITDGHCEATKQKDGRHYPSLDASIVHAFAQTLASME